MTTGSDYAQRAAAKLHQLMDELGCPFDLSGRSAVLGLKLHCSPEAATALLSGSAPWSLDDLAAVCTQFERSSCFFLEPSHTDQPADVQTITSADGGETIVWRVPPGFTPLPPPGAGQRLRYITCRQAFGPFPPGGLLVYAEQALTARDLQPGHDYIIATATATGLAPMRCLEVRDSVASFCPSDKSDLPHLVPLDDPQDPSPHVVGALIGIICPAIPPLPHGTP